MGIGGAGAWARERDDFVRAFAGAYIFGIPLLFTMEMWWIGEHADLRKTLAWLVLAFASNLGLTYAAGFKRETTFATTVNQTINVLAVGVVAGAIMLLVLDRIALSDPLDSILSKIVLQAVPLSIGASVASEVFGSRSEKHRQPEGQGAQLLPWQTLFSDVGATIIGGIFIGFAIAPTEEVPMLAIQLGYAHLVALIGFSLLLSYGIVYASGFATGRAEGPFQRPLTGTALAYVVSLVVAFVVLYLFGRVEPEDPLLSVVQQMIVLGVPVTVGGAAGRLVI